MLYTYITTTDRVRHYTLSICGMHHAFYFCRKSLRQFQCAFGLHNDLRWAAEIKVSVLFLSVEPDTISPPWKGWKDWLAWAGLNQER